MGPPSLLRRPIKHTKPKRIKVTKNKSNHQRTTSQTGMVRHDLGLEPQRGGKVTKKDKLNKDKRSRICTPKKGKDNDILEMFRMMGSKRKERDSDAREEQRMMTSPSPSPLQANKNVPNITNYKLPGVKEDDRRLDTDSTVKRVVKERMVKPGDKEEESERLIDDREGRNSRYSKGPRRTAWEKVGQMDSKSKTKLKRVKTRAKVGSKPSWQSLTGQMNLRDYFITKGIKPEDNTQGIRTRDQLPDSV